MSDSGLMNYEWVFRNIRPWRYFKETWYEFDRVSSLIRGN